MRGARPVVASLFRYDKYLHTIHYTLSDRKLTLLNDVIKNKRGSVCFALSIAFLRFFVSSLCICESEMALDTVPKDLRHLRACLLCSLVKVTFNAIRYLENVACLVPLKP